VLGLSGMVRWQNSLTASVLDTPGSDANGKSHTVMRSSTGVSVIDPPDSAHQVQAL
jgi:hypothetical protein